MSDGVVNRDALRSYADRIEHLHDERDDLSNDVREVYREAKDAGFDTTILREIVRERRMEPEARHSRYALLDSYRVALGMLADTPLGEAAMSRASGETPRRRRGPGRPRKERPMDFLPDAEAHLQGEPAGSA